MFKVFRLFLANLKELFRNKAAIFWTLVFPMIFILIFGMIYGNEDIPPLKVGLVVEDHSPEVSRLTDVLKQVPIFALHEASYGELQEKLRQGEVTAVIVIPEDFSRRFAASDAELIVEYDPANRTSANIVKSALQGVSEQLNQLLTGRINPISVTERSTDADLTRQIDWLVPGILGMSIMQLGLFSSAALVTLREKKIFRRFAVTPLTRQHVILSQVLFRLVYGLAQAAVLLLLSRLIYGVTIQGNLLVVAGIVALSTMMFLAFGYVIASLAKNEEVVEPLVQVFAMPMMFLSGVFFPVDLMPQFIQPVVRALPLTYLNDALRGVINHGESLVAVSNDLLIMGVWLVVTMAVAVKIFRWE